jgi:hypothetical protein
VQPKRKRAADARCHRATRRKIKPNSFCRRTLASLFSVPSGARVVTA